MGPARLRECDDVHYQRPRSAGDEQTLSARANRTAVVEGLVAGQRYTVGVLSVSGDVSSDSLDEEFYTRKYKHTLHRTLDLADTTRLMNYMLLPSSLLNVIDIYKI